MTTPPGTNPISRDRFMASMQVLHAHAPSILMLPLEQMLAAARQASEAANQVRPLCWRAEHGIVPDDIELLGAFRDLQVILERRWPAAAARYQAMRAIASWPVGLTEPVIDAVFQDTAPLPWRAGDDGVIEDATGEIVATIDRGASGDDPAIAEHVDGELARAIVRVINTLAGVTASAALAAGEDGSGSPPVELAAAAPVPAGADA